MTKNPLPKKLRKLWLAALLLTTASTASAQTEIYPQHFALDEVTLLDSPFKTAMELNINLLLQYDADRILAPFIRQAGLDGDSSSTYYNWTTSHPTFDNWGWDTWSLEGHIGGHYLSALALAYAASHDSTAKASLKNRLDYMLAILKDCQDAYDDNTDGLYGFLGGQPLNDVWTALYRDDVTAFNTYGSWVPFYCQHKVLAGLRDAWLYAGITVAKELFRKLANWSVNVVSNITDTELQGILDWEHGGMNETLADAYRIFGDTIYLNAAKRYSHQTMLDGMQTLSTSFLDGKHANTQVPKYIGFERIYQEELRDGGSSAEAAYQNAAHNFWTDVAENRTVCIGGNSVSEYFLAADYSSQYIDNLDGPESCNSNNMLKLSEELFDETHEAKYADFYEQAIWNHILSTQDPATGGYVYFTTLRPQGYRIYSTVNESMWCCVGTGMENHSKYGHFIYTHSEDNDTLYVNLFTASQLESTNFALKQETDFPSSTTSTITIDQGGTFTLAIRHPHWATADYAITVNGSAVATDVTEGTASYVGISRTWEKNDVVEVSLPMELRYEECPNYTDYIAFKYGPILLAAQTTATDSDDAEATGLEYEELQNEYGGEGRMDHAPGSMATASSLSASPLLIGERDSVLNRITATDSPLTFTIDASSDEGSGDWGDLTLVPFYTIHHARYSCYWYQQTAEAYAESDMATAEAEAAALSERTMDFVVPGNQQNEAGHDASYSTTSSTGTYCGETYRDIPSGGYIQYTLQNTKSLTEGVSVMCRFTTADAGRVGTIYIDGEKLVEVTVPSSHKNADSNGFYNVEYPLSSDLMTGSDGNAKSSIVFRLAATGTGYAPGLYYLRLLSDYESNAYTFVATEWVTGDTGRVSQSNINYDSDANTITVNAGTGANNVCLMMDYTNTDYTVTSDLIYLLVKGSGLSTENGKSYLWWLNGVNRGTSVAPARAETTDSGEQVIAWLLSDSGIDDNCQGDTWNFSTGQTIFGLTATSGTAVISDINFVASVDDYITGIKSLPSPDDSQIVDVYNMQGQLLRKGLPASKATDGLPHGIYIVGDRKTKI